MSAQSVLYLFMVDNQIWRSRKAKNVLCVQSKFTVKLREAETIFLRSWWRPKLSYEWILESIKLDAQVALRLLDYSLSATLKGKGKVLLSWVFTVEKWNQPLNNLFHLRWEKSGLECVLTVLKSLWWCCVWQTHLHVDILLIRRVRK